nr:hypothetical protein CFP56_69473 [Quercus suber]
MAYHRVGRACRRSLAADKEPEMLDHDRIRGIVSCAHMTNSSSVGSIWLPWLRRGASSWPSSAQWNDIFSNGVDESRWSPHMQYMAEWQDREPFTAMDSWIVERLPYMSAHLVVSTIVSLLSRRNPTTWLRPSSQLDSLPLEAFILLVPIELSWKTVLRDNAAFQSCKTTCDSQWACCPINWGRRDRFGRGRYSKALDIHNPGRYHSCQALLGCVSIVPSTGDAAIVLGAGAIAKRWTSIIRDDIIHVERSWDVCLQSNLLVDDGY